jgi:hypothetical protein
MMNHHPLAIAGGGDFADQMSAPADRPSDTDPATATLKSQHFKWSCPACPWTGRHRVRHDIARRDRRVVVLACRWCGEPISGGGS